MNVANALRQADALRGQALVAAAECQERSERLVTAEIFYHMPDQPHVVNTFLWQEEDRFDAGDKIVKDLTDAKAKFVLDETQDDVVAAFRGAVTFYQATVKQAWAHLEKITRTHDRFEIPFSEHGAHFQADIINDVPFSRLRKFLHFWREEIEGPLNHVDVSHSALMSDRRPSVCVSGAQSLLM